MLLERFGSGGVERVACLLANGLVRRGLRVEFIVLANEGPVRAILAPEVKVTVVGRARRGGRGARLVRAVPAIARHLKQCRPRIFLSPGNHTNVAAALAHELAGARDVAFVAKVTNPILKDWHSPARRWLKRRFYRHAFARVAMILVLSRKGVRRMSAIDPALVPITRFVHNPYVTAAMMEGTGQRPLQGVPLILSAGRLSRQKNQAMLLEAAAMMAERPWHIRIVGTGPEEANLREKAAALGIADRVSFAGFVTDMGSEYRRATLLALPSRWEDLPATMIEALACGCPVVATASSEAVESFLEEAGAIPPTPVEDVAAFATALAKALDGARSSVDPALLRPYEVEASVEEHLALLRPLLPEAA